MDDSAADGHLTLGQVLAEEPAEAAPANGKIPPGSVWSRIFSPGHIDVDTKSKFDILEDIRCEKESAAKPCFSTQDKKTKHTKNWSPLFDSKAFDLEHGPLERKQYALRANELEKYAL